VNSFKLGSPGQSPINGAGNDYTLTQPFGGSFPRWKGNTSWTGIITSGIPS
jgi:iron complex outermembrane receptor protein